MEGRTDEQTFMQGGEDISKKKENEVRKRGKGPCFKNYCEGRTDRRKTDTSINLRKDGETDGHIRIVFRSFQAIARWKKWTKGGFNAQKKRC